MMESYRRWLHCSIQMTYIADTIPYEYAEEQSSYQGLGSVHIEEMDWPCRSRKRVAEGTVDAAASGEWAANTSDPNARAASRRWQVHAPSPAYVRAARHGMGSQALALYVLRRGRSVARCGSHRSGRGRGRSDGRAACAAGGVGWPVPALACGVWVVLSNPLPWSSDALREVNGGRCRLAWIFMTRPHIRSCRRGAAGRLCARLGLRI